MFFKVQESLTITNSIKYHFKQRKAVGRNYISHKTTRLNVQYLHTDNKKKVPDYQLIIGDLKKAAAYSTTVRSTIGDGGLNFSVRNGKRWDPAAIAA